MLPAIYELSQLKQWVTWQNEPDEKGDMTKVPYLAKRKASSTKPKEWLKHWVACKYARTFKRSGIGFVFSPDDPYVGIDLDDCIVNGQVLPWAQEIIDKLHSYCEVSPSGNGVKLWVRGKKPPKGIKALYETGKIEIYGQARYFTVTEQHLPGTPDTINGADLSWLYEQSLQREPETIEPSKRKVAGKKRSGDTDPYAAAALAACLDSMSAASDGNRNDVLNATAYSLARLVAAERLSEAVYGDLRDAARQVGLSDSEIEKTLQSGIQAGLQVPNYSGMDNVAPKIERPARKVDPATGEIVDGNEGEIPEDSEETIKEGINCAAEDFAEMFRYEWRYDEGMHLWRQWTGTHWQASSPLYIASKFFEDGCYMGVLKNGKRKSLNRLGSVNDVLTLASELNRGAFNLDQHKYLLNVANGVLDLRTGKLQEHDRSYGFTYCINVPYEPGAPCPLWEQFITDIFDNDQSMISFVQRAAGYSLTGDVSEQVLFFCYGSGKNGKSTFLNILYYLIGQFSMKIGADALLSSKYERPAYELADLPGKRLVIASELESKAVNEAVVKDLTGDDIITARQIRSEPIRFQPTHKLWMYGNAEPIVKGTDDGIWRRFLKIPFTVSIPPEKRDKDLKDKIIASELPGVLAWCVQGAMKWCNNGLQIAQAVNDASLEYRERMDIIGRFIQEECITGSQCSVKFADFYERYVQWCEDSGEYAMTTTALGRELSNRGYRKFKRGYRLGLRLRQKGENFQECDRFDRFDRLHEPAPTRMRAHVHAHAHVEELQETDQTDQTDHMSQNGKHPDLAITPVENGYAVVENVNGDWYHWFEDERIFATEQEARQSLNGYHHETG